MQVHASDSGAAALAWLAQGHACDMAILDMQMPLMDGAQLADQIRSLPATASVPLVLLTSLGRHSEHLADGHFGASLTKPVKAAQLYETLLDMFGGRAAPPLARKPAGEAAPLAERLPLRILLAEDNAVNQKVATKILAKLGYRVDVAANGFEVLDALTRQPYDVVLMDVQMPDLDGLSATQQIRRDLPRDRQPRIIAMTANAMQSDREVCLAAGMDDYISKPVRVEDLVAALERTGAEPPHAPADAAGPGAVDRDVLEQLQVSLGAESPAIIAEIIDLFLEDLPLQIAMIEEGVRDGAAVVVQRAAHTVKASAATVGAHGLATQSQALEDLVRRGDLGAAGAQIRILKATSVAVMAALQEIRYFFVSVNNRLDKVSE